MQSNPQELWVPPSSRANIEQTFFNEQFGDFFRINTFFISPLNEEDSDADIFQKPYIEMLCQL